MSRKKKDTRPVKAGAGAKSGETAATKKRRAGPFQYLAQVRQEGRKVTWTGRQELIVSTIMVIIMSILAMLFFGAVDWGISEIIKLILGTTSSTV